MSQKYQRAEINKFVASSGPSSPIAAIVASPEVQAYLEAFEAADSEAMVSQARYRRYANLALRATTFGTLVGALLLLPFDQGIVDFPRGGIGALQTLALLITIVAIWWIGRRRPGDTWITSRAIAEQKRGELFAAILGTSLATAVDKRLVIQQKLECIHTAHVEGQLRYFDKSTARHAKAARRTTPLRLFGYALIVLGAGLGAVSLLQLLESLGVVLPASLVMWTGLLSTLDLSRWQLGFGTMASSLLAHATARSMLDQDERNAALYWMTAKNIRQFLERELRPAQVKAATGDLVAVKEFYRGVRQILEAEHMAWFLNRPPSDPVNHTVQGTMYS